MVSKVQGWKNNLLCHVRRETLIKAVVQAIPSYAMGDPGDRGIYWAKWDTTCLPKFQGEMDFRDFSSFNQAMLARHC
ncbi:hypothetical protein ACSBR1_003585 [Camellia fascicularis]